MDKKNESVIGDLKSIIKEELNVKNINYIEDLSIYMNYKIKPNYREVGKTFGPKIKDFADSLSKLSNEEIVKISNDGLEIDFDSEKLLVTNNMVDIQIEAKEGFCSASDNKVFVILNTNLTEELIEEGIARELVRKIQSMRKELDLVITDHIKIYYNGREVLDKVINNFEDYIKNETLSDEIIKQDNISELFELNEEKAELKIEKA